MAATVLGMPPLHPMFDDTFNQFQNMLDPSYQNTAMFNQTPSMSATVQEKKPSGERIIPIQVLNTSADNLINKRPVNMVSSKYKRKNFSVLAHFYINRHSF